MSLTASTMLPWGTTAPDFQLPDAVTGLPVSLGDFAAHPVLVVLFLCNHCPYVKHIRAGLAAFAREYAPKNVGIVAISANDVAAFPEDAPAKMKAAAKAAGFDFPYLFDETQQVAKAYRAACTPDCYVFDRDRKLAYRGQFDDSRPGSSRPVTGADLRAAVDALLAGRMPAAEQKPSLGCNIKWKPGNEPDYFG
jgi:peroxiredoxin